MTCWVALIDTVGNAKALVDTLADNTRDGGVVSIRTQDGAQALGDVLGDTLAEMEGMTPGDTLADANALYDLLSDS